jgi:hypothetical protein
VRVLFLDFDGVLNTRAFVESAGWSPPLGAADDARILNPGAVEHLNFIVEQTGAVVVVSSSWRSTHSLAQLAAMLGARGFRGRVHSATPELPGRHRAREIAQWLADNPVERFAVVDDDPSCGEVFAPQFVLTSFEEGLTRAHAERLVRILAQP